MTTFVCALSCSGVWPGIRRQESSLVWVCMATSDYMKVYHNSCTWPFTCWNQEIKLLTFVSMFHPLCTSVLPIKNMYNKKQCCSPNCLFTQRGQSIKTSNKTRCGVIGKFQLVTGTIWQHSATSMQANVYTGFSGWGGVTKRRAVGSLPASLSYICSQSEHPQFQHL